MESILPQKADLSKTSWITIPDSQFPEKNCRSDILSAYFRLRFQASSGQSLIISVSASDRYRLWVNGEHVVFGPCKGDHLRQYYETIDISEYLKTGENVLAAKVVSFPPYESSAAKVQGPSWMMSKALGPCFFLAGKLIGENDEEISDLSTGNIAWSVRPDQATEWKMFELTKWMGAMEQTNGSLIPHEWRDIPESSDHWILAETLWKEKEDEWRLYSISPVFTLKPRPIPLLYQRAAEFVREMPLKEQDLPSFSFAHPDKTAYIPPNHKMAIELDAGELFTAFLKLHCSGGKGSRVILRYSECYTKPGKDLLSIQKGRRDDWENFNLTGHEDVYYPSGKKDEYEPFWFRTFRFIRIEVETAGEGLTIGIPLLNETGYPLTVLSEVESPEKWINNVWDISLRTLMRCMHETYEDCPYYEQMQYTQDTRLQILFTYMVSGDTRLAKRAIEDFHCSLLPDGILQARYPSDELLIIPPFACQWIQMLSDYHWQTGDLTLIARYRPTIDAILDWYDRKIGSYGLVDGPGYWDLVDWVDEWNDIAGRTPASAIGASTTHNLIYVCALQSAAQINRLTGRSGTADEYLQRAEVILKNVQQYCWSDESQLYKEGPLCEEFSQHAQVYAVLSGLASGKKGSEIMKLALEKSGVAKCSFAWQFFLFRALEKSGVYELSEKQWDLWKVLPEKNLTTIPETPEGSNMSRSDCHAWGALALYEFTSCILGVKPGVAGWEEIHIQPQPLSLPAASGKVITPKGIVYISWKNEKDGMVIDAEIPSGVRAIVTYPDGCQVRLPDGKKYE